MTVRVVALAIIGALVGVLVRECGFRGSAVLSAVIAVVALTGAVSAASEILSFASELSVMAGVAEAGEVALKLFGIGYLFGFAKDTCEALGERALSGTVALCARIEATLLVIPYFKKILSVAISLLE